MQDSEYSEAAGFQSFHFISLHLRIFTANKERNDFMLRSDVFGFFFPFAAEGIIQHLSHLQNHFQAFIKEQWLETLGCELMNFQALVQQS